MGNICGKTQRNFYESSELDSLEHEDNIRLLPQEPQVSLPAITILELPDDIQDQIVARLADEDFSHYAQTCRTLYGLFRDNLRDKERCHSLHDLIVKGKQEDANQLLSGLSQDDIKKYLTVKATVTDPGGHQFHAITAFQYTLWAYDRHMWQMLLTYFQKAFPENWREIAGDQLQELETKGTSYGVHFDFEPLISECENIIEYDKKSNHSPSGLTFGLFLQWNAAFQNELGNLWQKIGNHQKMLPVHVVNEYCRPDRDFNISDNPEAFMESFLPRTICFRKQGSNSDEGLYDWYEGEGRGMTVERLYHYKHAVGSTKLEVLLDFEIDLNAIYKLVEIRQSDYKALKNTLLIMDSCNHRCMW